MMTGTPLGPAWMGTQHRAALLSSRARSLAQLFSLTWMQKNWLSFFSSCPGAFVLLSLFLVLFPHLQVVGVTCQTLTVCSPVPSLPPLTPSAHDTFSHHPSLSCLVPGPANPFPCPKLGKQAHTNQFCLQYRGESSNNAANLQTIFSAAIKLHFRQ